jgi:hypothetical protein
MRQFTENAGQTAFIILTTNTNSVWTRLLRHMCQLMGEQLPSFTRFKRGLTSAKYNVVSYGVGMGVHVLRRSRGSRAGMHSHPGKVVADALLHVQAHRRLQRPASACEDLIYAAGRRIHLPCRVILEALYTRWRDAKSGMSGRRQHPLRNQVGFLFEAIPGLVNLEFGLQAQRVLLLTLTAFAARNRAIVA